MISKEGGFLVGCQNRIDGFPEIERRGSFSVQFCADARTGLIRLDDAGRRAWEEYPRRLA